MGFGSLDDRADDKHDDLVLWRYLKYLHHREHFNLDQNHWWSLVVA